MTPVVVTFMNDREEVTLGPFSQGVVVEKAREGDDELVLVSVADDRMIARADVFYNTCKWEIEDHPGNPFIQKLTSFDRMFVQAYNTGGPA